MDRTLGIIRFVSHDRIPSFLDGAIYMSSLLRFAEIEGDSLRSDPYEGDGYWFKSGTYTFSVSGSEDGPYIPVGSLTGPLRFQTVNCRDINVCCFYGVAECVEHEGIDPRVLGFGDAFVAITKPDAFFERIRTAAAKIGKQVRFERVRYVDESTYQGSIGPFVKQSHFAYQSEFRVAIQPGSSDAITLHIGDIRDIAVWGATSEMRWRFDHPSGDSFASDEGGEIMPTEIDLDEVKAGPAESGVLDIILKRWSPRSYADRPVPSADLVKIFTAAAWAASSFNEQPWRFLVGKKGDETYAKILDSLVEFNQAWAKTAPVLILSVGKRTFTQSGHANGYGLHDTGAASATMSLQATALGLHTHGMGGVNKEKARELFGIPEDFEVGAVWALGYLGEPEALPEAYREAEMAARTRKPLAEFVFAEWEKAAVL